MLECNQAGKYRITDARGENIRLSKVRDEALSRVIRYAMHHKISRFWIDQECIPQNESREKQVAMDSMDLVYRHSRYPVGLLAIKLESQHEVDTLQELLMGRFVFQSDKEEYTKVAYPACSQASLAMFRVLGRLYADRWWTRAWIFQEEYLSSTNMHLLIRCKPGVEAKYKFGILRGELCVNAADFREQATLFLLAFKQETDHKLSKKCAKMLKRFGKYNVQYHFQHDARRKAMSPRVFADIQRRGLEQPFDHLPIAANSCDYALRFVSQQMLTRGFSVGLCLLAMFLLNGEILRNARDIKKSPTEMDVCNYLKDADFMKSLYTDKDS
ncbi:hypothetical protein LTR82_017647 [Friedmanniomyces endolithicus]|uniref:Heterokaryon incompatibility domain-containing protein n=1 Tax=Friedmanniomyces endolithicus TaxID=329885 RepID=A0AAN6J0K8_9PEZI|nr:hypothetical protein LTR82_017647 [Friedmanniomyces endolithicus]